MFWGIHVHLSIMPVSSANQSLVDNSSCLLYPVNITQPQIVCWSQVGVECLKVYLVVVSGMAVIRLRQCLESFSLPPPSDCRPRYRHPHCILAYSSVGVQAGRPGHPVPCVAPPVRYRFAGHVPLSLILRALPHPMHVAVWWKNHRELVRLCLNAPRALVSLIIYLIGFGRIVDKYAAHAPWQRVSES